MSTQAVQDKGLVYIYQNGKLTTASGKIIEMNRKKKLVDINDSNSAGCKSSYGLTTDGLHTPLSLLDIAINFVADNLALVDSLIGFPDIIGKRLFELSVARNILCDAGSKSFAITKLFSDAYEGQMLSELHIHNKTDLEVYMEGYGGLHVLTKLDLSGCCIGDEHDILKQIGQKFNRWAISNLYLKNAGYHVIDEIN